MVKENIKIGDMLKYGYKIIDIQNVNTLSALVAYNDNEIYPYQVSIVDTQLKYFVSDYFSTKYRAESFRESKIKELRKIEDKNK